MASKRLLVPLANVVLDPVTSDPSTLQAGQRWYRTDLNQERLYDGTRTVIISPNEGSVQYAVDYKPVSANVADDEFDIPGTIDTTGARRSGATAWNKSQNVSSIATAVGGDMLTLSTAGLGGSAAFAGYGQALAAGTFTYQLKCRIGGGIGSNATPSTAEAGFALRESATGKCEFFVVQISAFAITGGVVPSYSLQTVSGTSFTGGFANITGPTFMATAVPYLRVARTATNVVYSWSLDGNVWFQFDSHALTGHFTTTPNEIYVCVASNANTPLVGSFDWLRRFA